MEQPQMVAVHSVIRVVITAHDVEAFKKGLSIQPGGSVRDAEVIAAADEKGLAMVFTGLRHFRH